MPPPGSPTAAIPNHLNSYEIRSIALGEPLAIASITAAELLTGAELGRTPELRLRTRLAAENELQRVSIFPFDLAAARIYARLLAELRTAGYSVGGFDLVIASTALANDCSLVTLNLREFNRIPGLEVIAPEW